MTILQNKVIKRALVCLLIFIAAAVILPINILIEILNGLFIGTIFTVFMMFRRVLTMTLQGIEGYGRVEQFSMSIMFWVLNAVFGRLNSIWIRATSTDDVLDKFSSYSTALVIATGICAGLFMVTAPGWNDAYIHTRDRRTLYASTLIGLCLAFGVFMLQRLKLLLTAREYLEWLFT